MRTINPIIQKYLNVNGVYSSYLSEERRKEVQSLNKRNTQVQHFPNNVGMKNGENIFNIGNIKF